MTATNEADPLDAIEIWEATTESSHWIWVYDHVAGGAAMKTQQVGGLYGNGAIQLTVRERRYNQDMIPSRNAHLDPFLNGSLVCRRGTSQSPNGYTDDQLITLLTLPSDQDDAVTAVFEQMQSEIVLRRLLGLAERHAPAYRRDALEELVDERFRIGKTQRSLRDDLPEKGVGNGVLITR